MKSIFSSGRVAISGAGDQWKVAELNDPLVQEREVRLEIQGDEKNGYHLVMTPEECFTADTWHEVLDEAIAQAEELFGVPKSAWKPAS